MTADQMGPRVVLCPRPGTAVAWCPPAPPVEEVSGLHPDFRQDLEYVGRVLWEVQHRLAGQDLTIYVTRDVNQAPPSYGPEVVVVVLADEFCRLPPYANRVGAVFKRFGTAPHLLIRPSEGPVALTVLKVLQWLHKWAKAVPGRLQLAASARRVRTDALPVHVFPLGYFRQEERAVVPIEDRPYDVLFYGSAVREAPSGIRRMTGTVKGRGRREMLREAERLKRARSDLHVEIVVTDGFGSTSGSVESYQDALMRAKLCLSPAGNSEETYRNYEAWRYGTIPVTEALPPLWFHESSPFLRVRPDWADLGSVVDEALGDQTRLRLLHDRSLAHWRDVCSEPAVGAWMADRLRSG